MSENTVTAATPDLALWWEVQEFLYAEADLLDERRYDEWLALLDDDVRYHVPLARNIKRGDSAREYTVAGEAAWFDERLPTLRQRVAQIKTGMHWAEEPASRVSHLVTNIRLLEAGDERVTVGSRFLIYQNRLDSEQALFVGKRRDVLRRGADGGWRILEREARLDQNVLLAKALTVFF